MFSKGLERTDHRQWAQEFGFLSDLASQSPDAIAASHQLDESAALWRTETDMEGSGTQGMSELSGKCIQTCPPPFLVLVLVWFQYLKLQLYSVLQ